MSNNQNKGEKCTCEKMTCDIPCNKNHTCHTYWCEKCKPERYIPQSNTLGTTMEENKGWVDTFLKWGTANGCGDLSVMVSVVSDIRSQSKAETQIEHCSEKDCPECNLVAYNKGKEDGFVEGANFTSAYKIARQETIKEIYMHASLYSDGSYTLLHDYLKQKYPDILTLLSKDIEQ